jgi:hypothetical protein
MTRFSLLLALASVTVLAACGDGDRRFTDADTPDGEVTPDSGPEELTLLTGAPVTANVAYEAVTRRHPGDRTDVRDWIPIDVAAGPWGEVWIIQRLQRSGAFDDVTECTERGAMNFDTSDDDCISLEGSTVSIADPANPEPASADNGRAILTIDFNAWHFMSRPSAIAFGAEETTVTPDHPGAQDRYGTPYITAPVTYMFPFATCSEAAYGNFTDGAPFMGPSLWTADPAYYNGENGSEEYSNGSHLDMVHGTQYCTGIAWERDNVYWAINGTADAFDRYDFGLPHLSGHFYHEDATITRYQWDGDGPVRVPDVPSNAMIQDGTLYVADSGNGRVIAMNIDATGEDAGTWFSFEGLECDRYANAPLSVVVDEATLSAEWGAGAVPSGLGVLNSETLVVANNASGHISLIGLDGTVIRTIDTGLGEGIGGLTVFGDTVYFVHMTERKLYRLDVESGVVAGT